MTGSTNAPWRRVGVIVPSTNTMVEADFKERMPSGVTVHASRMYIEETTIEDEFRMIEEFTPGAIRDIASVRPDVVVFGCTSAGATIGADGERRLIDAIHQATGAPVVSINSAVARVLQDRGVKRPAVVTAYQPELTEKIVLSLAQNGIEAQQACGLGILDPFEIVEPSPEEIIDFVKQHVSLGGIDGIFISCANLRSFAAVEALEEWSGVPVVTSNQAAVELTLAELEKLSAKAPA